MYVEPQGPGVRHMHGYTADVWGHPLPRGLIDLGYVAEREVRVAT